MIFLIIVWMDRLAGRSLYIATFISEPSTERLTGVLYFQSYVKSLLSNRLSLHVSSYFCKCFLFWDMCFNQSYNVLLSSA